MHGAGAFGVETSAGWVVYTGDLWLYGKHAHLTKQFIKEVARLRPAVLICEGTHLKVERPVTEEEVAVNSFKAVKKESGLVVLTPVSGSVFFSVYSLVSCLEFGFC
ncbi:MAG: hypothetical protein AB1426_12975 [Bacillota bacterium]